MRPLCAALFGCFLLAGASGSAHAGAEETKFSVAVYHFNLQYVAGGLEGFVEDMGLEEAWAGLDYTEEGVEDAIIRESFVPLLELFAAHPTWGADFELQGLMVDVIRERHPDVLALMQELDGRVHFDSFHYSDELWTAQPAQAIARSRLLTEQAFSAAGLEVGGAVFTQEGQFGIGMEAVLPPDTVAILPRNLFGLHYPTDERQPLFRVGELDVVIGGHSWATEVDGRALELRWTFMDDGELLATNDLNPYALPLFLHDPDSIAAYEQRLVDLEAEGFVITTVSDAVTRLRSAGLESVPLPPILDGSWQPDNTENLGLWMGGAGVLPETEGDNAVRTAYHRAYTEVRLAELAAAQHDLGLGVDFDAAWRLLTEGGVSDATGWNPLRTEVAYGLDHSAEARAVVAPVFEALRTPCAGCLLRVDGRTAEVSAWSLAELERAPAVAPPLDLIIEAPELEVVVDWFSDPRWPEAAGLSLDFSGIDSAATPRRSVRVPLAADQLRFVPAGQDTAWTSVPLSTIAETEDVVGVPLANGLLDLGAGWFLVLDPAHMMVAARVDPAGAVAFEDETPAAGASSEHWELYFVQGEEAARSLADELVQAPAVWLQPLAVEEEAPPAGCQCSAGVLDGSRGAPLGLLALPVLLALRRRRRAL